MPDPSPATAGAQTSSRGGVRSSSSGPLDDDLADLENGGQVRVVRNVAHNLLRVRPERRLESLGGRAEDVTHADVGRGCAGRAAGQPFVHGVIQTCLAETLLDQGHVLVAVVFVIESGTRGVRVHHADLDHHRPPASSVCRPTALRVTARPRHYSRYTKRTSEQRQSSRAHRCRGDVITSRATMAPAVSLLRALLPPARSITPSSTN